VGRFWSLLFLMVPVLGVGAFVIAAADMWPIHGHWLPENINDHGGVIDSLFMFILYLTGVIFIATGLALFWFLWKYDATKNPEPVKFTHGNHTLEVVWSILPAATLLFIAIYQMNAWADAKLRRPIESAGPDGVAGTVDDVPQRPLALVTGRQFEWRIHYAGPDQEFNSATDVVHDDLFVGNELHVPVHEEVVLQIESQDVLHSFFLPNMRIKQDVVPGMKQFVWFRANKEGTFDIVCAELCGWGHYKMKGRLTVESREKFDRWLAQQYDEQERRSFVAGTGE
jgi:cytochrome c oxidase subunit 2